MSTHWKIKAGFGYAARAVRPAKPTKPPGDPGICLDPDYTRHIWYDGRCMNCPVLQRDFLAHRREQNRLRQSRRSQTTTKP